MGNTIFNTQKLDFESLNYYLKFGENLLAFHSADPDGLISALIVIQENPHIRYFPIPISHKLLRGGSLSLIENANWDVIVDLPPFNRKKTAIYADHHESNLKLEKNSDLILFDHSAPSTATILDGHYSIESSSTKELVHIAEITDTASLQTPPPRKGASLNSSIENKAWLLYDAIRSVENRNQVVILLNLLVYDGIQGILPKFREQIIKYRKKRKKTLEIIDRLDSSEVVIVFVEDPAIITHEVNFIRKGALIQVVVWKNKSNDSFRFSVRIAKNIRENQVNSLQIEEFRSILQGQGHFRAFGGSCSTKSKIIRSIKKWCQIVGLEFVRYDFQSSKSEIRY